MPRQRSVKFIFVEAVVFIGLLALVGHLSVNFWERFIIQSELTQMKTSLHSLKETLAKIGIAYDHLHEELKDLVDITEKKRLSTRFNGIEPKHTCKPKFKQTLDRRRLHDLEVKTLLLAEGTEYDRIWKQNKSTEDNVQMESKNLQSILKRAYPEKNATTLTRYPPKSTGVGRHEIEKCPERDTCRYKNKVSDEHKCCRDFEYCQVKHYCNNWKY